MTDEFDGYRKWLGIAGKKGLPSHYELLGITLDEDDPDVIRATAEQRRRFVESKRGDGHDKIVTEILYRISEAEATLLNAQMRRDYDRKMNLFEKRQKNRQVDPQAPRSVVRSQPGRTVGEDSGIMMTAIGVMAVVCVGFGIMAWFSFQLPWTKEPKQTEVVQVQAQPEAAEKPHQEQPVESQVANDDRMIKPEIDKRPETVVLANSDAVKPEAPFQSNQGDEDATAKTIKLIQGEWACIAMEEIGIKANQATIKQENRRVTITGTSFTMRRVKNGALGTHAGTFEIDASKGHFDFVGQDEEWTGIFELNGDILKLCYRYKKNQNCLRPKDFKTDKERPNISVFYTYKRDA